MRRVEQQVVLRSAEMQRVEARFGRSLDVLLREWHHDEGLTLEEIGQRLELTKGAVSRWMDRFGVERRRRSRRAQA